MIMTAEQRHAVALTRSLALPLGDVVIVVRGDFAAVLSETATGSGPVRIILRPSPSAVVGWPVDVHFGPLIEDDDGAVGLPLWWEAARFPSWFPTFDAALEIVPGVSGTELRLVGGYEAPLGVIGVPFGHRLARACLDQFLTVLADRLTARVLGRPGAESSTAHCRVVLTPPREPGGGS
jgi:hypothetical protein